MIREPILLSLNNWKTDVSVPKVEWASEDKPVWIVYVDSGNGDIVIDINDEDFIFVFRAGVEKQESEAPPTGS